MSASTKNSRAGAPKQRTQAASSLSKTQRAAARVEGGKVLRKPARKKKARSKKQRFTAKTADKYELYQLAVQSADTDVAFHRKLFRTLRGREPLHFREDFCGTGLLSSEWIKLSKHHTAEGFDIDPEPVAWGLAHNFDPLGEAASRYTVHLDDVRAKGRKPADVRVAQNFSYYCLTTRAELLEYFKAARADLGRDGIFVIDLYGGSESGDEMEESQRCAGFHYIWEQAEFWPGTGEYLCYIHFRFPDGTQMRKAFTYKWRQWYLTELRDILEDAGFAKVISYFEGTAKDGESGDGNFRPGKRGENCASWIAYLVALK
ncbi:MAG TPA: class I SAM-dependent methyltransferase [Planctomycetota bacterium]|nr:class I SAM-dependent methyltransferase [Planctomycetota bacterium]